MADYEARRGYEGALGIAKETDFGTAVTPPTLFMEIESETLNETRNWFEGQGVDGTRSKSRTREAETTRDPRGNFVVNGVKGRDLSLILELLLGNYSAGTAFLGSTIPSFTAVAKKADDHHVFAGCKLASGQFEASEQEQALKLTAELLAASRADGDADDLGTPSYDSTETPLVFARSTFTVGGSAARVKTFTITVDNALAEDGFYNSQTRLNIKENGERDVSGSLGVDWNSANRTLFLDKWQAAEYAQLQAVFTNGVKDVTFRMPNCKFPTELGQIANKEKMDMPVSFNARASAPGQQDEITIFVADAS